MKVAILGDVHANLPALEAVLADVAARQIRVVWNLGDFVGYGPFPDEVVRRLQNPQVVSILGNYDRKVLDFEIKKDLWRQKKSPKKFFAFQWAHEHLSPESRQFLRLLPPQQRFLVGGNRVLMVHGSPVSDKEALGPRTPRERLIELGRNAHAEVICCGHSHQPFVLQTDGVWWINPGSVGRPEGGDPRACYAVISWAGGRPHVTHCRVPYNIDRTAEAIRRAGLPEEFAEMLRTGRNLEEVTGQAEEDSVITRLDLGIAVEPATQALSIDRKSKRNGPPEGVSVDKLDVDLEPAADSAAIGRIDPEEVCDERPPSWHCGFPAGNGEMVGMILHPERRPRKEGKSLSQNHEGTLSGFETQETAKGFRIGSKALSGDAPLPDRKRKHASDRGLPVLESPSKDGVLALAKRCRYEPRHAQQVTRLALSLFDQLATLHGMDKKDRRWLEAGAMLHDIGSFMVAEHHKVGMRLVLEAPELPLGAQGRRFLALLVRYHRKSPPSLRHGAYAAMSNSDRRRLAVMAALLRVADGLDRSHTAAIRGIDCRIAPKRITLVCQATGPAAAEQRSALEKGDCLEQVFKRRLAVEIVNKGRP